MAKQEKRKIRIKCQRNFYVWLTAQATVLIASFVLSLYDRKVAIFDWTEEIQNVMGILSQVMISIISLIVSIIAISISLQNEEFFGVKVTKIYSLRVKPCYSIRDIIIISIGICVVNLIFYIAGLYIAMIGTMIVALLFLLQVLISEIPVMTKDENAICYIIKNKFILSYKNKEEIPTDLKKTLKYLLYKNNLKFSYDNLQEKEEDEYNRYLFFELLDIQAELAKDIKEKYEGKEQLEGLCPYNGVK